MLKVPRFRCLLSIHWLKAGFLSLIIVLSAVSTAQAGRYKLKCKGPYQVLRGHKIANPACEEAYFARVARTYGYRTTKRSVQNPSEKILLCQTLGHDIRLQDLCGAYRITPSPGGR